MDWKEIFKQLDAEERLEMACRLIERVYGPRRLHFRDLRPGQMLLPAALAQMLLFAWVMLASPTPLPNLLIGNVIIVGAAILPSAVLPRRTIWSK